MKYRLLAEATASDLSEAVRGFLGDGWKPFGSPSMVVQSNGWLRYCQAVVKED